MQLAQFSEWAAPSNDRRKEIMMKLFEYAVLYHPKVVKDAQGNETQGPDAIVSDPKFVLAKDEKEIAIRAARAIPDTYLDKLDQVEIVIRPF